MLTTTDMAQQTIELTPTFHEGVAQLPEIITQVLQQNFEVLEGEAPNDLYKTVIAQAEAPLLKIAMEKYRYNQSRVAQALGLSRGTLRAKLQQHFKDKYVGTRVDKATDK